MTDSAIRMRKPLLAVAVETRRTSVAVLSGIVLWAFVSWAITSILAGRGAPFDYAIHNYSIGELRLLLWLGTSFMALGVAGAGGALIPLGASLLYILATCRYMRDL